MSAETPIPADDNNPAPATQVPESSEAPGTDYPTEIKSTTSNSSDSCISAPGCGCLTFLVLFILYKLGYVFLARIIGFLLFQGALALLSMAALFVLLMLFCTIQDNSKKYKGWKSTFLLFLTTTPVIKELFKVSYLLVDPFKILKEHAKKRLNWYGAAILSLALMNIDQVLLSKLKLPPEKVTAAASIYLTERELLVSSYTDSGYSMFTYIGDKLSISEPTYYDLIFKKNTSTILRKALFERLTENPRLEFYSENLNNGLSILQLVLEHDFKISTSDDIKALMTDAPLTLQEAFEKAIRKEDFNAMEFIISNLITVAIMLVTGLLLGVIKSKRKRNLGKALAGCSYMFAAVYLFQTISFAVLGKLTYLFMASSISLVLTFLYAQIWLLSIIPSYLKISIWKTALLGNFGFGAIEVLLFLWENYYYNLGGL